MIARLSGKVLEREDKALIIDVAGLGYRVTVLGPLREQATVGSELTLRIHHHVSDDAETLFGFATQEDLKFFILLLTVPSVGPRTAMNILEAAPPKTLAQAVAGNNVKVLTKVSGVGKKTAERILVELKEKFKDEVVPEGVADVQEEVLSALENMGFTKTQAREAVHKLPGDVSSVEDAVKSVLQQSA